MFEILEHTADIGFRATAQNLPELFANAAEALVAMSIETAHIEPRQTYRLSAEGDSPESLLVNWLSEVLYHIDGPKLAMRDFRIEQLDSARVLGNARGETRDPARHPGRLIVKGITYHQLKIEHTSSGWICEVFLDI